MEYDWSRDDKVKDFIVKSIVPLLDDGVTLKKQISIVEFELAELISSLEPSILLKPRDYWKEAKHEISEIVKKRTALDGKGRQFFNITSNDGVLNVAGVGIGVGAVLIGAPLVVAAVGVGMVNNLSKWLTESPQLLAYSVLLMSILMLRSSSPLARLHVCNSNLLEYYYNNLVSEALPHEVVNILHEKGLDTFKPLLGTFEPISDIKLQNKTEHGPIFKRNGWFHKLGNNLRKELNETRDKGDETEWFLPNGKHGPRELAIPQLSKDRDTLTIFAEEKFVKPDENKDEQITALEEQVITCEDDKTSTEQELSELRAHDTASELERAALVEQRDELTEALRIAMQNKSNSQETEEGEEDEEDEEGEVREEWI